MKKLIVGMLALSLAFSAIAQGKKHDRQGKKMEKKEQFSQRYKGDHFAKKLNLTDDQRTKMQSLNEDFRDRMKELNKQENITVKEQKERREALLAEHKAALAALLTPEQRKELEEQKKATSKEKGSQDKVDNLDRRLDLTDAQGQKIKEVNQDFRTKMQEVQKNESLSREQKKEQIKTLQQTHTEQIKSILTEEQKNKLEALKRNKSDRRTGK
jgi:Spy/CpxP family protein refolding chaperone